MEHRPLLLLLVALAATGLLALVIRGFCYKEPDRFETEQAPTIEAPKIEIGEAVWTSDRLGLAVINVPFVIDSSPGVALVTVDGQRFTLLSSIEIGGIDVEKKQLSQTSYEFVVTGKASGVLKLSQSAETEQFSVGIERAGGRAKKTFNPPEVKYPPDDAKSDKVSLGPIERSGSRISVPFSLKPRTGNALRATLRAPPRTVFVESVSLEGDRLTSASDKESDFIMPPEGSSGKIEIQQTGESEFTLWLDNGGEVSAILIPKGVRDDNEPGDKPAIPPKVTPVLETTKDMVDLDAFPFRAREPVHSRVIANTKRVELGVATAERVIPSSGMGHVVRLPFALKFTEAEVPKDTNIVITWELDPATTQVRHLLRGKEEFRPQIPMTKSTSFEANVRPGEGFELVLDQPLGRRPVTISLGYAGEKTTVLLEGDTPLDRTAGFVGSREPVDFKGNPPIRFTDVHESAEQRVVAMFKSEAGREPDEQTTKFLMSKYFEWSGDMHRLSNLAASIATMVSENKDDESSAVQRAIAALQSGASPGEAKDALKNWKEFETHRSMWRPDTGQGGYAGDTALKRPWGETAVILAEGHSSNTPAVAENAASAFDVVPGESSTLSGQSEWLFV